MASAELGPRRTQASTQVFLAMGGGGAAVSAQGFGPLTPCNTHVKACGQAASRALKMASASAVLYTVQIRNEASWLGGQCSRAHLSWTRQLHCGIKPAFLMASRDNKRVLRSLRTTFQTALAHDRFDRGSAAEFRMDSSVSGTTLLIRICAGASPGHARTNCRPMAISMSNASTQAATRTNLPATWATISKHIRCMAPTFAGKRRRTAKPPCSPSRERANPMPHHRQRWRHFSTRTDVANLTSLPDLPTLCMQRLVIASDGVHLCHRLATFGWRQTSTDDGIRQRLKTGSPDASHNEHQGLPFMRAHACAQTHTRTHVQMFKREASRAPQGGGPL